MRKGGGVAVSPLNKNYGRKGGRRGGGGGAVGPLNKNWGYSPYVALHKIGIEIFSLAGPGCSKLG